VDKVNPSTPWPEGLGLLRVDPEPRFITPPQKAGLGAAEWVKSGEALETELYPLTHHRFIFLNRSPNRTNILWAQEIRVKNYKTSGENLSTSLIT
jgi:hypothetical protein